jgi:hypothetical protein
MKRFMTKKVAVIGLAAGLLLGGAGAAFAYFTTSGGGTGTGTTGSPSALVIHQASITYSNSATDNTLMPGTSATVTFTVDNNSSGQQQLGTISLASWTSGSPSTCSSAVTGESGWFTMTPDAVNQDYAPGTGQTVPGSSVITFNDLAMAQNACAGQTLTFTYAS